MQLPSFALPAHPYAVALGPNTLAMEDEEARAVAGGWTIAFVQARDSVNCNGDQIIVTRQGFARRVQPIREQREAQGSIWIRQIVHFQPFAMLSTFPPAPTHPGHADNLSPALRTPVPQF